MKVLITGAKGQVGFELMHAVPEWAAVTGLGSKELDITDEAAVMAACRRVRPDLIINAAAYTAVDKAESDQDTAFAVNATGVDYLGKAAAELDIPIFHISTDYVFDGMKDTPYLETDTCNPQSVYGASKLAGEQALAQRTDRHVIMRTSWVFGRHGNNFVKTMLRLGSERDTLGVIDDQKGCPTSARSIALTLWNMAERYRQEQSLPWGIYHFCNDVPCSWYEFACAIFDEAVLQGLLAKAPTVNPIPTEAYPLPAKRPQYAVMDVCKLMHAFRRNRVLWQHELRDMLASVEQ
ncbi:dTDP-4-dehydrorhamnose reductase [Zymobacter sp. IVIA_5232.4 C2]|uniref:dTDP-4-dehydrorhamnose reductase n=1 Tax=Zymobacter sp. IVIA_5232.4 C2 TaxID=3394855 RepID=UPI0039C1FFC6